MPIPFKIGITAIDMLSEAPQVSNHLGTGFFPQPANIPPIEIVEQSANDRQAGTWEGALALLAHFF
jgi:hypothetical protein